MTVALQPPRSVSLPSRACQLTGAQKSSNNTGPAWRRTIASPPRHGSPGLVKVFPVITNILVPSLATPPWPQMPPPSASVAQAITLEGLLISTPTTQPWYGPQSPTYPEYDTYTIPFTRASAPRSSCTSELKIIPLYIAVAFTSTGQPGFVAPVSTSNE